MSVVMGRAFGPARMRSFSSLPSPGVLLERLSGQMGSESAKLELKWMREELGARRVAAASATSSTSLRKNERGCELGELGKMVDRRLRGEPLQYILGGYGSTFPPGLVFQLRRGRRGLAVSETTKFFVTILVSTLHCRHCFLIAEVNN